MTYTIDPCHDPRWGELIRQHPAASVFCTQGWLEALRLTYGYEAVAYTTTPPSMPLNNALLVCRVKSWLTGNRLVSLPFSDHCEPLVTGQEELNALLEPIRHDIDSGSYGYFEVRPARQQLSCDCLSSHANFMFHELDLRPTLDELLRKFHTTAVQQMIRRAEREQLTYEEGRSEQLLREFYRLILLTRRRHQLPPAPLAWFRNLLACLPDNATVRLAVKDGRAVAAILTLTFGNTVVYKYGCSDANQHKLGGIAMLLWQTIKASKAQGVEKMDFGRSDLDNPGLVTFKERWGATATPLVYYRYPVHAQKSASQWRTRIVPKLFSLAPDRVLTIAGNLLYRHMG